MGQGIDTLVLGCTHYPLLKPAIRKIVGKGVALVDSAQTCAAFVRDQLRQLKLLVRNRRRPGIIQPYVTDEAARFAELADGFSLFPPSRR